MQVLCTFNKTLTFFQNFLYSKVAMMSLSLAYYLAIAPVNIVLKCFKTSSSPRLIRNISSDCEVTSRRINLESNKRYKRKVEWYNGSVWFIWINGSSPSKNVLKLSGIGIADWNNMAYSFLTGCLNALTVVWNRVAWCSFFLATF